MKRPITNLVIGCLAFFAFQLTAQTATFTVSPTTVTAAVSTEFTVDITVNDFDDLVSFQYSNDWNPAILEFVGVTNVNSDLTGFSSSNIGTSGTDNGDLTVSWFDNTYDGATLAPGAVLYSLTFNVLSGTGTTVGFLDSPSSIQVINASNEEVSFTGVDCAVNGGGTNPPSSSTVLNIAGSEETGESGTNVCMSVTAMDFTEIVSMQFSMHWNTDVMTYSGVQNFGLPDLIAASFGTTGTNNGTLSVSWFDTSTEGVSLNDGDTVFEVCFDLVGASGEVSSLNFDGTPTTIEFVDANSEIVTPSFDAGLVIIDGGTPPPPPPSGDLDIIGSDETAASGTNVCVDVTANNFTDIVSMQFSMHWNQSIMTYSGVQGFGIPDLAAPNFGTTGTGNGDLSVSWFDTSTEGISVANGATIFQVCFDVIGTSGQVSPFNFDGVPTTIEFIDDNSQQVTPSFDAGSVTVDGGTPPPPPPSNGLTIIGSDETGESGTNVCVDVTADNFDEIVSMQFSMHWNENIVSYTGVQAFGLPDLIAASFGTSGTGSGDLSVSWFDQTTNGISVADGSTLFQVCFDIIGTDGQVSAFSFDGVPTIVEFIDAASQEVTPTFDAGSVTVDGGTPPPPPPTTGFAIIASDETMESGDDFCVEVSVNEFDLIVSMQYTMEWDETLFEYTGVQNFGLPDLSAASFGTSFTDDGILTVSWFDNTTNGITRADGDIIYEVCFTAIGPNDCDSSSEFEFTGNQAIIEVIDASSMEVPFQGVPGDLIICDGVPTEPMAFTAATLQAAAGAQVCVPITVENPECFVSAQFSMHFDEDILEFTSVQGFGLPLMVVGNFNTTDAGNGNITFSWFDQTTNGVTPAEGAVMFELCFNVIGDEGEVSTITFDGVPTIVEVVDCSTSSQNVDVDFNNGSVTVSTVMCPGPVSILGGIVNNVPCAGDATGSIDLSVGGGNNSYSYSWSSGQNTEDIFGLIPGLYCVTVTSCSGMETANNCYTISEPSTAVSVSGVVTNPPCFGDATGSIDVSVTGGTTFGGGCSGYTYAWSSGQNTQDLFSLTAGVYTVTVTDCNGCQEIESFSVVGSPSALTLTATPTLVTCFDDEDGTVTISANGGVGPYDYRLTGGGVSPVWQTSPNFNGLKANSYFASVRDEFGCVETVPVAVLSPSLIVTSAAVNHATLGCNGLINLTVNGGTQPYTYNWDNGFTGQDPANLCPGDYCVTITDVNGCTKEGCETVIAPLTVDAVPATIEPACFDVCDGEITLNFDGGSPPYTYDWSGPGTPMGQQPFTQLCGGSYTVTVSSSDGQSVTINATVGEASAPVSVSQITVQNVSSPITNDGLVTISANGGFPSYTYDWSPGIGMAGPTVSNLGINDYFVTVTDSEGCTALGGPYEVEYDPTMLNGQGTAASVCAGAGNAGTIFITTAGGFGPFDFNFDGPTIIDDIENHPTGAISVPNLTPGTYSITVTDSAPGIYQQTDIFEVTIEEVQIFLIDTTILPVTNGVNGAIDINVGGNGAIPYDFDWSNASTAQNPSNLTPGCYDLTITDANGCAVVYPDICVEEFQASFTVVQPDCPDMNGSITVLPIGSENTPFSYEWADASGTTVGDGTATLADVPVGTYSVTITDSEGRSITMEHELTSVSNLTASLQITSDYNGYAIRCHGGNDGSAEVTVANGVTPYTYAWSNGSTTDEANDLEVGDGTVSVVVTDNAGCNFELSALLNEPTDLSVTTESLRDQCGEDRGQATANPAGGVGPFDYNWDDDRMQTGRTATLLAGGIYTVTVVDDNGCSDVSIADVPLYVPLVVDPLSEPDEGGPDGKAIANVTSGTPPYEFQWSGYVETDSVLVELLPGLYNVIVTDAADCEELVSIRVEDATLCLEVLTVITPEGDGFNEEFKIGCLSRYSDNTLQLFNRWGQLVYMTKNYSDADLWRGTNQRGNDVPDGVYYYVFDYLDPVSNTMQTQKGSVSVLRN